MKKVHERAKRLANKKKMEIIDKEERNTSIFKEVKRREARLVDFRYRNRITRL